MDSGGFNAAEMGVLLILITRVILTGMWGHFIIGKEAGQKTIKRDRLKNINVFNHFDLRGVRKQNAKEKTKPGVIRGRKANESV